MATFRNDYCYLAHPRIIKALNTYKDEYNIAYGLDKHSARAEEYIKKIFATKNSKVYFLAGGTQSNMTFITYCLKHYEGVISCDTGHINVHESACIEGNGHKIITVKNKDGKLTPTDIEEVMNLYQDEHMVKPSLIYISNSTELGTIYSKEELIAISKCAKKHHLYFFIDGARLGAALTSKYNNVEPSLLGEVCDAFYVGGTKNGLLYGEALVINNPELQKEFRYHIKNKGAMLAKGYGVGIQFEEAFKDGLYFEIAKHTNEMAELLKQTLIEAGYQVSNSPTNQIFVTVANKETKRLVEAFQVEIWEEGKETTTVRFVASFNTKEKDIEEVKAFLTKK